MVLDDGNQYVYGAGLESMVTGTGSFYYLADGLGSTMAVVDSAGAVQKSYTYHVYGEATATGTLSNEFDFAGQQTDASTGLQYLRARYMDPETGTFISREPLAMVPAFIGNPFGYAGAQPTRMGDPSGLWPVDSGDEDSEFCSRWCLVDFTEPTVAGATLQWLEVQNRSDDLYWRMCWQLNEKTHCGSAVADKEILSRNNPQLDRTDHHSRTSSEGVAAQGIQTRGRI